MKNKRKEKVPGTSSVIVSISFSNGIDNTVMLVGQRNEKGVMDICNAIQGEEAEKLYCQLLGDKADDFKKEVDNFRNGDTGETK